MAVEDRRRATDWRGLQLLRRRSRRLLVILTLLAGLTQAPVAAAHGGGATAGLTQVDALVIGVWGLVVVGGTMALGRTDRLSPAASLYGVLAGLAVVALGAILFDGLIPDPTYDASTMPFPRSWYGPLTLGLGLFAGVGSFVVGWLRWPTRPRYTFLGLLLAFWIAYEGLLSGHAAHVNPLGYLIVLATPLLVGYIVWRDAGDVLQPVLRDPVARRFGVGVAGIVALFFMSMSGYLSFFPEADIHERTVAVLPAVYQLVAWPTLEVLVPDVPVFIAISPGILVVMGVLSGLIGLNAALVARHWRVGAGAGTTESTAGTGAIMGTCTCGCCGPLVAKLAVVAAGPSLAAPLYWVFIDSASPLGSVFIVGSILLFTGTLVYSVESVRESNQAVCAVPAD